jgi:hypothetical protein
MKVSVPIVKSEDDVVHELAVEVQDDVATIYIDGKEVGKTDFENLEDLFTAVGLLWGNWKKREVRKGCQQFVRQV